jgi:hypothetical protein
MTQSSSWSIFELSVGDCFMYSFRLALGIDQKEKRRGNCDFKTYIQRLNYKMATYGSHNYIVNNYFRVARSLAFTDNESLREDEAKGRYASSIFMSVSAVVAFINILVVYGLTKTLILSAQKK